MTNLTEYPEAVQKLAGLPDPWALDEDFTYRSVGIKREHIPALISLLKKSDEWLPEAVRIELPETEADPETEIPLFYWMPLHAWRALGELEAVEAVPALLEVLHLIDDDFDMVSDMVQEEVPPVLAALGKKAIPQLTEYMQSDQHGLWARLGAADALSHVGILHPAARGEVVQQLMGVLEGYDAEEPVYNSFIISFLMEHKAVEAAELVEQVFASGRIEEDVMGDWEDFQVGVGLLEQRTTPAKMDYFDPFAGERTGGMDFLRGRSKEDKQTKKKRKQAKETRKKNRKRKKK